MVPVPGLVLDLKFGSEFGQVLRGDHSGPVRFTAPDPTIGSGGAKAASDADAAAAGAVIDILHQIEVVTAALGAAPVAELRSGTFIKGH